MNDIKKGRLTVTYLGLVQWGFKQQVPTCNVHHEFYVRHPVATFHANDICFKPGVTWCPGDLNDLILIFELWKIECERIEAQPTQQSLF